MKKSKNCKKRVEFFYLFTIVFNEDYNMSKVNCVSTLLSLKKCFNSLFSARANLELVHKFCYSGDMLSVDGDADAAVEARIQVGWNKFRQLVLLLTNKDM